MTITPQDIQSKQFHVRMRGFDMDEVDKFLEQIAEELLIVSLENKQLLEKIETMDKELANYKNKEQAFQSAILSAQRISDEMQSKSRLESDELLTNAKQKAADIEAEVHQEIGELVEKSQQEATELISNAEIKSRQILDDSQQEHKDLTGNINRLIEIKSRIMADMRQLLNNYLDHIEEAVPAGLNALEPLPQTEETTAETDYNEVSQEEEAIISAPAEDVGDTDLEDLYEKIDLSEQITEDSPDEQDQPATLDITDIEPLGFDDDDDDEMLFPLEDPLDELEPSVSVSISEDDKTG